MKRRRPAGHSCSGKMLLETHRAGHASCYECGRTIPIGAPVQPRCKDRIPRALPAELFRPTDV